VQYGLYKKRRDSGIVDRIYTAGNPNQSIYGFRGANPTYLADTPVDTHFELTEPYRCPSVIVDRANATLGWQHGPQMEAKRDGGLVFDHSCSSSHELAHTVCRIQEAYDDVFLLARTNRHVRRIAYTLRPEGIPYADLKGRGDPANQWYDPAPEVTTSSSRSNKYGTDNRRLRYDPSK
jgi:DNA helicase II / ATP-dependent DNA helicase PcrA